MVREINQLSDLNLGLNFIDLSGKIISIDDISVDIKLYTSNRKAIQIIVKNGAAQGGNKVGDVIFVSEDNPMLDVGVLMADVTLSLSDPHFADKTNNIFLRQELDVVIIPPEDKTTCIREISFVNIILPFHGNKTPTNTGGNIDWMAALGLMITPDKLIFNRTVEAPKFETKPSTYVLGNMELSAANHTLAVHNTTYNQRGLMIATRYDSQGNTFLQTYELSAERTVNVQTDSSEIQPSTNHEYTITVDHNYLRNSRIIIPNEAGTLTVEAYDTNGVLVAESQSFDIPLNKVGSETEIIYSAPALFLDGDIITYKIKGLKLRGKTIGSQFIPYFKSKEQQVLSRPNIITEKSIVNYIDTANDIRDKLKSLTGDDRLSIEDLKDVEDTISPSYIKDKLEELTGSDRLSANAIKGLQTPKTTAEIVSEIESLQGDERLDANRLKNLPTFTNDTAEQVRDKLKSLTGDERLDIANIKNAPSTETGASIRDKLASLSGDGRLPSSAIKDLPAGLDLSDKAQKDLSNVQLSTIKSKSVQSGMLQQDLEDVDLTKLKEKIESAKANRVKVGELHGDYHEGAVKEIQLHNGLDVTIDQQNEIASISLSPDMLGLTDEVTRLKTDISNSNRVFSYRGTKAPTYKVGGANAYYLNITSVTSGFSLKLPSDAPVNALFTIRNSDKLDPFDLTVDSGTINNAVANYPIQANGLAVFIKNSPTNWNAIYSGFLPNNLKQLLATIKTELPDNAGLTIDEIQAQLKDRLHLFSEIQTEFNDELHTFDAIEANMITKGFSKGFSVGYGMLSSTTPPIDNNWIVAYISPSAEVIIPSSNTGMKYLAVYMPSYLAGMVDTLTINGSSTDFTENEVVQNENYYKVLIANTQVNTANNTRLKIEFKQSTSTNEIVFLDGLKGTEFQAAKIKSSDKSIRISEMKDGFADLSKGFSDHNEGIHVLLGNDELINSKYDKSKLYFGDIRVGGGMFVYPEMDTKSFVLNDTDPQDDPNISSGTTYIIAFYYEPDSSYDNKLTQKGSIIIGLVDDNDNIILDNSGNPMAVKSYYNVNDDVKPLLYVGEVAIKVSTKVHLKIKPEFQNEELISVGANTQLCFQSTSREESGGLALLSFMTYTGYALKFDNKYYGFNSLNLASRLLFNIPESATGTGTINLGENLFIDTRSNLKLSINNYHLNLKDDNVNLPVFSISKVYNRLDSENISGRNYKVSVTLTNKQNAFYASLLEYKGLNETIPQPRVESYLNGNPIFTLGWSVVDSLFIAENPVDSDYTKIKEFSIPDNSKGLAVIFYSANSQIPLDVSIKDIEGDITPWFSKVVITDNSHISEKYLLAHPYMYKTSVNTPRGYTSYRYTCNSIDTKIPIGVVSGGDGKIVNDNSWTDPGSIDPEKTQGDLKFLADGLVKMSYSARLFNEQGSKNNVEIWLAKNINGAFIEVPNSKILSEIDGSTNSPRTMESFKFSFEAKANETYRMFMKSNKDDGFYIQSDLDGNPLFSSIIEFDEITSEEQKIIDKLNLVDDEIVITKAALDANCYIELDYKLGKPVLTAKQR